MFGVVLFNEFFFVMMGYEFRPDFSSIFTIDNYR